MADSKGYVPGDYNAYCDYCEGQYLASQLKKTWDGFMACPRDFTTRNPQDFVRPKTERIVPEWTRPTDGANAYQVANIPLIIGSSTYTLTPTDPTNNIYNFTIGAGNWGGGGPTLFLDNPSNLPLANLDYTFIITCVATGLATNSVGLVITKAAGSFTITGFGDAQGGQTGSISEGHYIEFNVNKTKNMWWYTRRGQS